VDGKLAPGSPVTHQVLPDACVDLIFDLEAARTRGSHLAGEWVGTMTRALVVEFSGRVDLFGVRFRPGGAAAWLRQPIDPFTDRSTSGDELWGARVRSLGEQLCEAKSFAERSACFGRFLLARPAAQPVDPVVPFLAQSLDAGGAGSIERIAADAGLSARQFERRISAATGLAPAGFRRVSRFRRALHLLEKEHWSLARAAAEAGYFDQSHMTRDFERLAGVAPTRWRRARVGFVQEAGLLIG
jgi:AraC-like DNA-binding protein